MMSEKKTILILEVSPKNLKTVRCGEEVREIKNVLEGPKSSNQFVIQQEEAVRREDIQRVLLKHKPQIVHFCGHGDVGCILLEDTSGESKPVSKGALSNLFGLCIDIQLVFLNACDSESLIDSISQHIEYVIGIRNKIPDSASIDFARGFYGALGVGIPIEEAFKWGCNAIKIGNNEIEENRTFFFPVLKKKSVSISGIENFYSGRRILNPLWWDAFYDPKKNPEEVIMMGQSQTKAFEDPDQAQVKALLKWCEEGTKVKILFLSPGNPELSQIHHIGRWRKQKSNEDSSQYLIDKIKKSLNNLGEYVLSEIPEIDKKPEVRFSTCDLPFSLLVVGEEMLVTLYGIDAEGDNQPTFLIKGKNTASYQRFKKEFNEIWSKHSKVYPYKDPIISSYKKAWNEYISLKDYSIDVPPPRQAIIFPTYHCQENCSYCMFQAARTNPAPVEMEFQTFKDLLEQLIAFKVKYFELSGGGEPLEHSEINKIINYLEEIRKNNSDLNLGLLTNGRHLGEYDPKRILSIFNDYIRISRYENLEKPENEGELIIWKRNINALIAYKRIHPEIKTQIGIKYLLTKKNKGRFVKMVQDDLNSMDRSGVQHFRFRSDRKVAEKEKKSNDTKKTKDIITKIEQQVYYILESAGLTDDPDSVSFSLSNVTYPINFRCWVSPMNVVIDPIGEVYICPNYLHDPSKKSLGIINNKKDFKSIWQDNHHKELRKKLRRANCKNNNYSNCRYAEIQNLFEQIALTVGV